jgi:hypothetical protein
MEGYEELHTTVTAYLHRHKRVDAPGRSTPPGPLASVQCRSCGRSVMDVGAGDLGALGPLLAAHQCADCYIAEATA